VLVVLVGIVVGRFTRGAVSRVVPSTMAFGPARLATLVEIAVMGAAHARETERILHYPPDTAGWLMDPRVISFREGTTIAEVLPAIPNGRDPATASSIILTTITDIVGFGTFLGLATALSSLLV
jgi:Mg/Co/Ni transporter MgtE